MNLWDIVVTDGPGVVIGQQEGITEGEMVAIVCDTLDANLEETEIVLRRHLPE